MNLNDIGLKYQTDKSSICHHYTKQYEFHFASIRESVNKVLEIGVLKGASLKMWADYFPNAEIVGLDINPEIKEFDNQRIKVLCANQADDKSLKLLESISPFDIIIDDGSHWAEHYLFSFFNLFKLLKPGGLYFIEDLQASTGNPFKAITLSSRFYTSSLYLEHYFGRIFIDFITNYHNYEFESIFLYKKLICFHKLQGESHD
jgi:ubiquinone/menaquinone biosynthesis C-methylase UbiE